MVFRKCLAFSCALLGFLATAWVVPAAEALDSASCEVGCSEAHNRCVARCQGGEAGRGCRAACGQADIECREACGKVAAVERSPLSCLADCARMNEGCLRGCAAGEEGDACRASCAQSDASCRQSCEKVRARPAAVELSDAWVCSGPVDDCSSPDHSGSYGCAYAAGSGSTARKARSAARDDCQDQLGTAHGGSFSCKGLGQLDCHERD